MHINHEFFMSLWQTQRTHLRTRQGQQTVHRGLFFSITFTAAKFLTHKDYFPIAKTPCPTHLSVLLPLLLYVWEVSITKVQIL
jgi:hypothetical protein